jgi:hypothetical protein
MREGKKKESTVKQKGPVIPAGTEQETGLTRGQTEKPSVKKSKGMNGRTKIGE